jgi:cytochrome c oxidase subunit 2
MAKLQGLLFGLATLALVVLATFYFVERDWLPPLNSERIGIDKAIGMTLLVTGIVFILTNLLLAYFSWRYSDREGAPPAAYWHDDPRLEWTWTLATAGIMAVFLFNALDLWAKMQNTPPPRDAVLVEVTGQQFRWIFRYPGHDGKLGRTDARLASGDDEKAYIGVDKADPAAADDVILVNQLYLPAGRAARVQIRSTDVIHSFFLPNFRVKQDAMPGMTIENWFIPQQTGEFEIACAELCGLGHYRMRGDLHVVDATAFDRAMAGPPEEFETALQPPAQASN